MRLANRVTLLSTWSKTRHRSQGYAKRPYTRFRFGRLQSYVRLMPDVLVLRSKIILDKCFLPCSKASMNGAYPTARLWFYPILVVWSPCSDRIGKANSYSASMVEMPIVISSRTSSSTLTVSSDVSIVMPFMEAVLRIATPST